MNKLDLNLLVIFDAIMSERSITEASHHLNMTQPSVSNAVARMRHEWNDPIFVKQGRGIKPTPYAETLWNETKDSLENIRSKVTKNKFAPMQSTQTFRIAVSDFGVTMLWLPLRRLLEKVAPHIKIHAVPYALDAETLLTNGDVDLVFDYYRGGGENISAQWLFDNYYMCVMKKGHVLANKKITIEEFVSAEHLFVSLSGDPKSVVDELLLKQNKQRKIAMTVNNFTNALSLIENTNLISILPSAIVESYQHQSKLIVQEAPLELPVVPISLCWHLRNNRDPGIVWLREIITQLVQKI